MEHVSIDTANAAPVMAMRSLFDIHHDNKSLTGKNGRTGPRKAHLAEIFAYAEWLALRAGLAPLEERQTAGYADICGVTFGECVRLDQNSYPAVFEWETGSFSVPFPGRNAHRDRVTMETLDEAGQVVASSTMPLEPKKGGVVWDKEAVRKACGVVGRKCPPIPVCEPVQSAAVESVEDAPAMSGHLEALSPSSEPESAPVEVFEADPAPLPAESALVDRVAALEAMVQALLTDRAPAPVPVESAVPVQRDRARRERIVLAYLRMRRERVAARADVDRWQAVADDHMRMRETVQAELRAVSGELAAFKRLMPDSSTPARPADLAKLIDERNEARAQLASEREKAQQGAHIHNMVAEALEEMTGRALRAETALRAREARATPYLVTAQAVTFAQAQAA